MARTKKPAAAPCLPMNTAAVDMVRTQLDAAVRCHIALREQEDDADFTAAWAHAMRPDSGVWASYLLLPLLAFPDDPPPNQTDEAAILLAPALLAPTLALLAFAPGGLRVGPTVWEGRHPAATRLLGYQVTDDGERSGISSSLLRRIVQTLHLLFPLAASDLLRLPMAERWAAVQRIAASLGPESPLFSEALTVGGTPAQMGQAMKELVAAVAAMACLPYGVSLFGYHWEIGGERP